MTCVSSACTYVGYYILHMSSLIVYCMFLLVAHHSITPLEPYDQLREPVRLLTTPVLSHDRYVPIEFCALMATSFSAIFMRALRERRVNNISTWYLKQLTLRQASCHFKFHYIPVCSYYGKSYKVTHTVPGGHPVGPHSMYRTKSCLTAGSNKHAAKLLKYSAPVSTVHKSNVRTIVPLGGS
jgi:hypothetical protein